MENIKQLLLIPLEDQPSLELLDKPRSLDVFANECYSPYPNRVVQKFVGSNDTEQPYIINPLPENLVAGKNSHVYDAHTYHTKVPPEAIARLIEHYTEQRKPYTQLSTNF